jgi:N-ethylmaleimide reductase
MVKLADPIEIGAIRAPNRMFMAPMTRARSTRGHVPTPVMAEYYRQRATAGLIISEAIGVSQQALGWPYAPGIWSDAQIGAWKIVTDAVHEAGGHIVAQLWHMGRLVHPDFADGAAPISSSPTTGPGHAHTYDGSKPYTLARPLALDEVPALLNDFARAAHNAMQAGFDGIQIHAANGYLIDQFLRDNTNFRTDSYGGPIENRIRLLGDVAERMVAEIGGDRVGFRLSPNGETQGVNDSAPHALFASAAGLLDEKGIAWLELREPLPDAAFGVSDVAPVHFVIREAFHGKLVLNCGYDQTSGQAALDQGEADAISFGRGYLATPDLPHRLAMRQSLNQPRPETFYTQGPDGYIDYPPFGGLQSPA